MASCGAADERSGEPRTRSDSPSRESTPNSAIDPKDPMNIQITVGNERFQATLSDSPACRDLVAQLPLTIEMIDHGSVEKTGPLPRRSPWTASLTVQIPTWGTWGTTRPVTISSSTTATSPTSPASWFSVAWTATQPNGSLIWMAPSRQPFRPSMTDPPR